MTHEQAQKMVNRALALKAKKEKAEARYEKRRKRYQELHKKITGLISALTTPIMAEIDQIKMVLEDWRKDNVLHADALDGVQWRRGSYKPKDIDLEALILGSVELDPITGQIEVVNTGWLEPNMSKINKRVSSMELMHGIPGVTAKQDNDTMVLAGKKDK